MTQPTALQTLIEHLSSRQSFWEPEDVQALEDRKKEELGFHNLDRDRDTPEVLERQRELDIHANRRWYTVVDKSRAYTHDWITHESPGRVVLDYACGNGDNALLAARAGAALAIGLDLSDVSLRNAREAAGSAGLAARCSFIQGDCENTELPDESMDRIVCCGMLHHLDLGRAYPELRRILKPGGKILCVEALAHNPLIQWYRRRTPHLRTAWEANHVLGIEHMLQAKTHFVLGDVRYWHLTVLGAVPLHGTPFFRPAKWLGDLADEVFLRVPGVQQLAWQFTFELLHPSAGNLRHESR